LLGDFFRKSKEK
nr:Chain H, Antibacterial protein FALL-39, core peptide [synthetic construct]